MFIVCYLVQADSLGNELCYSIGFKIRGFISLYYAMWINENYDFTQN